MLKAVLDKTAAWWNGTAPGVAIKGSEVEIHVGWKSTEKSALDLAVVFFDGSGKVVDFSTGVDASEDGSLRSFANSNKGDNSAFN